MVFVNKILFSTVDNQFPCLSAANSFSSSSTRLFCSWTRLSAACFAPKINPFITLSTRHKRKSVSKPKYCKKWAINYKLTDKSTDSIIIQKYKIENKRNENDDGIGYFNLVLDKMIPCKIYFETDFYQECIFNLILNITAVFQKTMVLDPWLQP